jgi:hypothetical protein
VPLKPFRSSQRLNRDGFPVAENISNGSPHERMLTDPLNSLWSSQRSSHDFNSESIPTHIGGSAFASDQQILTVTHVGVPSGNTPKVPGSRPGRPTSYLIRGTCVPVVADTSLARDLPCVTCNIDLCPETLTQYQ